MQKGKIDVKTENIFPIIKKFLYSDHEIFLRELISNAVDATRKLKTLASVGDYQAELGDLTIHVNIDKKKKTLTVSDRGVGMTEEEVRKYINQIAFSSAEDFLERYKDKAEAIIGHFGLGFYSSFMVAKKVEIITRSYQEDAKPVKWTCDGSPRYTIEEIEKDDAGTDIILHIADDSKEFLEENRILEMLKKYCRFLPVPIAFGKEKEWKDGKEVETERLRIVNETEPLWARKPADLKDDDYEKFYNDLYPLSDKPLFYIHLNVDYPFNLTGILYFPKLKNNFEIQKNKIQLYANQVYVTDSVEGVVPEFLTLLHGVIDSPDIPLNVSRSYLQSDSNVKKISSHISKKVSDRLNDIFKNDRSQFEKKWDDLKVFIEYGMLTDEKFYERAEKFTLLKNTGNKYFTFAEYEKMIRENQTDKHKNLIYLYATDKEKQYSFIEAARARGYDVLLMEGQLDTHFINHLETKFQNSRFVRVDADVTDKLIQKDDQADSRLSADQQNDLAVVFKNLLPAEPVFMVSFESMGESDSPVTITQSEFMRRMKDMSSVGGGMGFYGEMPDSFNLVINSNHPLVIKLAEEKEKSAGKDLEKIRAKAEPIHTSKDEIEKANKSKKEDEVSQEDKERLADLNKKLEDLDSKREQRLTKFAENNKLVKQLIDLALLSNNMLKGEDLSRFVKRSIDLM
ncbi:MAG: molecular chaperone HtpG [Marinilabiliales bacterium]|nr:MAG: molecular chaperone HtpG [Marinilabiliales bacterium]